MKASILATLLLTAATAAQTYTLQERGRPCGADLGARLVSSQQQNGIRFAVRSRLNDSLAVLVIGHRAAQPITLPGSTCRLFVARRATMLGMTNASGHAQFAFRVPAAVPIDVLFQAVVVDATVRGRRAASTDVVRLIGR